MPPNANKKGRRSPEIDGSAPAFLHRKPNQENGPAWGWAYGWAMGYGRFGFLPEGGYVQDAGYVRDGIPHVALVLT